MSWRVLRGAGSRGGGRGNTNSFLQVCIKQSDFQFVSIHFPVLCFDKAVPKANASQAKVVLDCERDLQSPELSRRLGHELNVGFILYLPFLRMGALTFGRRGFITSTHGKAQIPSTGFPQQQGLVALLSMMGR